MQLKGPFPLAAFDLLCYLGGLMLCIIRTSDGKHIPGAAPLQASVKGKVLFCFLFRFSPLHSDLFH